MIDYKNKGWFKFHTNSLLAIKIYRVGGEMATLPDLSSGENLILIEQVRCYIDISMSSLILATSYSRSL